MKDGKIASYKAKEGFSALLNRSSDQFGVVNWLLSDLYEIYAQVKASFEIFSKLKIQTV